jgi:transcriptional regulator GlxA family with amidase domain
LEQIAQASGFGNAKNLRAAFRRVLGASPNDFKAESMLR